jgi:hypothetical protein
MCSRWTSNFFYSAKEDLVVWHLVDFGGSTFAWVLIKISDVNTISFMAMMLSKSLLYKVPPPPLR